MKKIIALLLTLVMLFSMAACGSPSQSEDADRENPGMIDSEDKNTDTADNEDGNIGDTEKEDEPDVADPDGDETPSDDVDVDEVPSNGTETGNKEEPSGSTDTDNEEKPSDSTDVEDGEKPIDGGNTDGKENPSEDTKPDDGKSGEPTPPAIIAPSVESGTMGETLWNTFQAALIENPDISMEALANILVTDPVIQFTGMASPVESGAEYFTGFGEYRITGYDSAAVYAPMMGSMAFVGYVFDVTEGTDISDFIKALTDHCDPRWNICVEAEQTVAGAVGDKVFFVMCPKGDGGNRKEAAVISPNSLAEGTLGAALWDCFVGIMEKGDLATAGEIADAICGAGVAPMGLSSSAVVPGLLSGFDSYEVAGFSDGAVFAPMFGSTPFIGYIFSLDEGTDIENFIADLTTNANPAWNICVTADQTVAGAYGNTVFFVMCPANT